MTRDEYSNALKRAKADLISAIRNRDHWTMEVARLTNLVNALAQMDNRHDREPEVQSDEIGLQEVVYTCVRRSKLPITPLRIKGELEFLGYDLKKYKNAMAVIHGALRRLKEAGKVREHDGTYSVQLSSFYGR